MNRILIGLNAILLLAVLFLFYKVYGANNTKEEDQANNEFSVKGPSKEAEAKQVGTLPTGKIAYVNIDKLNEESFEISDMVKETKHRKENIEGNVESLSMKYQSKVEEFQLLQKGGIAPKSELEAKAKEIQSIEAEAQNKQLQMDQLSQDINQKNAAFQENVRNFLVKWNNGRYDYIFSYSENVPTMLLGNTSLEITGEVIEEINKEYKQRKLKK